MNTTPASQGLVRSTLSVLFIVALIAAGFWIIKPFLLATIWATMIVIATWPLMLWFQAKLGGKRGWAVLVMTLLLLAILIVPITFAITTMIEKAHEFTGNGQGLAGIKIPSPPEWLHKIPLKGDSLYVAWSDFSLLSPEEMQEKIAPYSNRIINWFLVQAGSVAMLLVHFLLTVIIAAVMYANGETAAKGVKMFCRRLAGNPGEEVAVLAGSAIRGVAIGILGTALIQSLLGGLALWIANVPGVGILTAVMLLLCVAQVGPALVLIPATVWVFMNDSTGWGIFMVIATIIAGTIDNVIRPFLIKKGADLPLLLIFAGVIGGLLSFGLIGLFIGPVMLAVIYTLLKDWVNDGNV